MLCLEDDLGLEPWRGRRQSAAMRGRRRQPGPANSDLCVHQPLSRIHTALASLASQPLT